ncbi:hypothetical protein ACH5RR_008642, partial [Cinchona calisaya]
MAPKPKYTTLKDVYAERNQCCHAHDRTSSLATNEPLLKGISLLALIAVIPAEIIMKAKCVPISTLHDKTTNWMSKLILVEKSSIRISKDRKTSYQRYLFADPNLTSTKNAFVRRVDESNMLAADGNYDLTPFKNFFKFIDDGNIRINVLSSVVHALLLETVMHDGRTVPIQEFVVLNEECRPVIFTMWKEFLDIEVAKPLSITPQFPVMLITRAKSTSFDEMILVDNCHINSEHDMVSDTLQINHPTNGEAEKNLHKQGEKTLRRPLNGSRDVGSVGFGGNCTHADEESLDISGIITRDSEGSSNSNMHLDVIPKSGKRHNDMTLEDIYNKEYNFDDDDDDDDSDWDPLEKNIEVLKWFCVNCTMVNFDDIVHCDVCGEHRESGILRQGFFASPFLPEGGLGENGSELAKRSKESCSQNVDPNNSTIVGFDERMLLHAEVEMKSHPHPERPDRLRAIAASLATAGIFPGRCYPILAREITQEELLMIHSTENVETVELTSRMLASYFTPDTYANQHSALAARLAAGLCADLATAVFSGRAKNGFALVRPPGHHAGVKQAMGFCLHNNAAIAASAAQVAGAKKVLIVDWDVHHGNGTQEIFDQSKSVLYVSLHRHEGGKFYPGTGAADEVGTMGAEGYCVNIPWSRRGVGDKDYIYAFQHVVIPIASEFAPDFTIISAGFDAARGDPLGCCDVTPAGFAQMTEMLCALSDGKLLVILEGGYNLRSISSSATAVIKVLLGESSACNLDSIVPSKSGLRTIFEVLKIQTKYWPALESTFSRLQSRWGIYAFQDA